MNREIPTSLGYPLIEKDSYLEIDLTNLRIFTGLSVLARVLGDMIIDQVHNSIGDVSILYKINYNINPELMMMHIGHIQIYARSGVLDDILLFKDEFHDHLRSVFGTFQRPVWGSLIHPEFYGDGSKLNTTKALIFPFHHVTENEDIDYQFVLERVENKRETGQFLFRLTIESIEEATLHLSSIPHTIVDDLKERVYLAGTTKLSESMGDKILTSMKKGLKQISEENLISNHVFEQLDKTGLGKIEQINFFWDASFTLDYLGRQRIEMNSFLKKLFLCLEDHHICDLLKRKETISIVLGKHKVFIYLTRLSRILNLSINKEKNSLNLDAYLDRMPAMKQLSLNSSLSLKDTRVFLIHHITSEILATIQAFRNLEVDEQNIMFVKYGGVVPSAYLEVLLELSDRGFLTGGIAKQTSDSGKDYFVLSGAYSDIPNYKYLYDYMNTKQWDFFEAMKFISGHFFLQFGIRAFKDNKKVVLVEDGGYLAPLWNQYISQNKSLSEVAQEFLVEGDFSDKSFHQFLQEILIGTVEHTRNGYDRLQKVKQESGLFFPAYTIALSNQKVVEESKEVAHSILSAIESVLHGQGLVLSRRKIAVLGSEGNIGKFLCDYLVGGRLQDNNKEILRIDIKYTPNSDSRFRYLSEVPREQLLDIELYLGVIGESILTDDWIEDIVLNSKKEKIFFASGSTKTLEFKHLSEWIKKVQVSGTIKDKKVNCIMNRIFDPQSGIDQGGIFEIHSLDVKNSWVKKLYLLGDLTPINFLFYGVPTEMMDSILKQLVQLTLVIKDRYHKGSLPIADIYALDHQIDEEGNFL
jgi:hypothetical protein